MKNCLIACAIGIMAFFAGRYSTHYSVPALALGDLRAVCTNYRQPEEEDLSGVRPFFEAATWVNDRAYWKEPWDYTLKDGRKLSLDYILALFVVDGVPGYYKIRPEDVDAFQQAFINRNIAK